MIKKCILALLCFCNMGLKAQSLEAGIKFPETAEHGKFFTIEVQVKKSEINSFMKYIQTIPSGFEVQAVDVKGAQVKVSDSTLKIIWIQPPAADEFSFSYKLKSNNIRINEYSFTPRIDFLNGPYKESVQLGKTKITFGKTQGKAEVQSVVSAKKDLSKDYYYTVQIGVFANTPELKGINDKEIKTLKTDGGLTKYFTGNYEDYNDALVYLQEIKKIGYTDAFIVKLNNNQ